MRNSQPRSERPGLTLLELMVVLALLIILAAVTLPSYAGLKGNSDQRAAADQFRSRVADARGLAMQEALPYRLAINSDGTKIRVAPDTADFASTACSDEAYGGAKAIETTLVKTTVSIESETDAPDPMGSDSWTTVATFLPNGTCREDATIVDVNEPGFPPIRILLRGVTGTAKVLQPDSSNNGGTK